eukprot:TRINITY_DN648_c0_g2_i1.p1 TRINITY_DN648_c0_g2~~TRINITY_DN648_c0_g2_i1.p1  ORF type:complete len:313 (-),score=54.23 TRINITY_DN648_c0_g2_i1:84-1022(-)
MGNTQYIEKMATNHKLHPTYGKQSVPVFKISKTGPHHNIVDMIVGIMLQGQVSDSWLSGENHQILPTETQKNTCYVVAMQTQFRDIETYAVQLANSILSRHDHIDTVTVTVEERTWDRLSVNGKPHNHVFLSSGDPVRRTCKAEVSRDAIIVRSGIKNLKFMKTTQSGFSGYINDEYTNLKPVGIDNSAPDRILCTKFVCEWQFDSHNLPQDYNKINQNIIDTMLNTMAGDPNTGVWSKSLQETTYNAAVEVLDQFDQVNEVYMEAPNVHFYTYPLNVFGIDNPNVVFQSTDPESTASGRIITHVTRSNAKL